MEAVTIKDIAKLAGVSPATVSRALNGDPRVKQASRAKILALCRQHGYRRNLLARSLSSSRTGLIGCILSDLDNPLFAELALVLEQFAGQHGYHVLFCHGRVEDADIRQVFDFLVGHRVDGVILASSSRQAPELARCYTERVPIILQGALAEEPPAAAIPSVCVDSLAGGRLAAEYLHRLGHREVVHLGTRVNNCSHALRCKGFLDAARRLGMHVRVLPNETNSSTTPVGYQLAKDYFFSRRRETAIFAACDTVALGVMAAAREFYIDIPRDLSLLGFDNISYAAFPGVRLSTLDHQVGQVVQATVTRLLAWIETGVPPDPRPLLVPPVLLERSTCQAV